MKIQLKYISRVNLPHSDHEPSESDYVAMGKMDHIGANISDAFSQKITGLIVSSGDIQFEYDTLKNTLFCNVEYNVHSKPTNQQLDELIQQSNEQINCGFYGDDGWFIDIGESSFYIDLMDKSIKAIQPVSVKILKNDT